MQNTRRGESSIHDIDEPVKRALAKVLELPLVQADDAILLYGSYARGDVQNESDVDVIVIGRKRLGSSFHNWPEVKVDLVIESQKSIGRKLQRVDEWNNHFWMTALSQSKVLVDPFGIGRKIISDARLRREQCPPLFDKTEAAKASFAIERMMKATKAHRYAYESLTMDEKVIRRIRFSQIVNRAIYICYKARGRWTDSLSRLIAKAEEDDVRLRHVWDAYVSSPDETAHIAVAQMVSLAQEYLREGSHSQ